MPNWFYWEIQVCKCNEMTYVDYCIFEHINFISAGVGKTSLVMRYVSGSWASDQSSTIGASFMTKRMFLDDWKVKLQIWDTAGQERFRSMTPMYYRGAQAAVLVYSIDSNETFDNVKDWVRELNANVRNDIIIAIAGNKSDLEERRQVPLEKAKDYAESIDGIFIETSAKANKGIEELFLEVTRKLIERHKKQGGPLSAQSSDSVDIASKKRGIKCCS